MYLQHVFVTIRGIEASSNSAASDDSPDWVELAPELARRPVQVDLMAPPGTSCESAALSRALVPAGVYRELRIRLALDPPAAGESAPTENRCGAAGLHCAVVAGGEIRPLAWNSATPDLHIPQQSIAGQGFSLMPDSEMNLTISFHSYAALVLPSNDSVRLAPILTASPNHPCEATKSAQP
jgi:hypothetical protein